MLKLYVTASQWLSRTLRRQEGQSMTEYALIVALIAIVVIAVLSTMGDSVKAVFQKIIDKLNGILQGN